MAGNIRLYLKLFGKPGFCFRTEAGETPLLPLPTPLWAMLLTFLSTCERQEASLDQLVTVWNETRDEETLKVKRVYGKDDRDSSTQIAKAAVTNAIADARRQLVRLYYRIDSDMTNGINRAVDTYTFLPKHQEQTIYLNSTTVQSDVVQFRILVKEISLLADEMQTNDRRLALLEQAKRLYDGDFLEGGERYFGRANSSLGERLYRPWIVRESAKLREQFESVNDQLRESSRVIFRSLPTYFDYFISRPEIGDKLRSWLLARGEYSEQPLLLLHGPGGAGKTRLAVESVRSLGETAHRIYADRIHFLSFVDSPRDLSTNSLALLLAQTAGAPKAVLDVALEDAVDALRVWLRKESRRLFVLDNFETVTANNPDIGTWLIETLRLTQGQVRCLVASQHHFALRLPYLSVSGLRLAPSPHESDFDNCESYLLYNNREQQTPNFRKYSLTSSLRKVLRELFAGVDGLPLAIEMLACRCVTMSLSQLKVTASVLKQSRQRLDFLTSSKRDVLNPEPRHVGMRACLAWTWNLLTPEDRTRLTRLGIFTNGFTQAAAIAICEVGEDQLDFFVSLSLMQFDRTKQRWSLLPMVAEFAREQFLDLEDFESLLRAFCDYYLSLAERLSPELQTRRFRDARSVFDDEEANLTRAQVYCIEFKFPNFEDVISRLAIALKTYRFIRNQRRLSYRELEIAMEYCATSGSRDVYRTMLCTLIRAKYDGNNPVELESLRQKLEKACEEASCRNAEDNRALALAARSMEESEFLLRAAIAQYATSGNIMEKIETTNYLAVTLSRAQKYTETLSIEVSMLPEAIEMGWYGAALIASNIVALAIGLGEHTVAEKMVHTSLRLCLLDDLTLIASWVLFNYAFLLESANRPREATRLARFGEILRNVNNYEPLDQERLSGKEIILLKQLELSLGKQVFEEEKALADLGDLNMAVHYALNLPSSFCA